MKTFLMHPDQGFAAKVPSKDKPIEFAQDIELEVLLAAAAKDDAYVHDIMAAACLEAWTNDVPTILYRQDIMKDCIANAATVRRFYQLAIEPLNREHSWSFSLYGRDPSSMVGSGVRTLQSCLDILGRLRDICSASAHRFTSRGFRQLFATLERDLDNDYLAAARADLDNLTFKSGLLLSAHVGGGGKAVETMLRKPQKRDLSWVRRAFTPGAQSYTLQLQPRDDAGAQAFGELQGRGLGLISDAVYQSARHVLSFIGAFRAELAFYIGCLNLWEHLEEIGESVAFPVPKNKDGIFNCRNLRDVCLALTMKRPPVGNSIIADDRPLVIIMGANRGGKSTFLRSVGLAQLMLQCGMFVTADAFESSLHSGLFTHFKRQEDRSMRSGKFDEELVRMSGIADRMHRKAIVLFNESFAATHEEEGSEIAKQIVAALRENAVTVFFVSHMYEFARAFIDDPHVLFLRAERREDGSRSFQLNEARPLSQSYGVDLYERIFKVPQDAG
ncbi:MutS-related protein [Rhizobium sp. SYY.PMSO]|uniref:MutS-related protein n=1 Tax=Rhizobium sp. SYY.PMSO TaxID=3382192 RepID=UPI00398FFBC2